MTYRVTGRAGSGRRHAQSATAARASAAPAAPIASGFQRPAAADNAAPGSPSGRRYAGSVSAAASSRALAKRSAGTFSIAFDTAAATFGGTARRSRVTGWGSSVTIFMMICCAEAPVCGGFPVSIS